MQSPRRTLSPCLTSRITCRVSRAATSSRPLMVLGLPCSTRPTSRPGEDRLLIPVWTISVCQNAIWSGQRSRDVFSTCGKGPASPPIVRSLVLPGRHRGTLHRCLGSPLDPSKGSCRLPRGRASNLPRESPVVPGPYQVLGTRGQRPRDQHSSGVHLGHQGVAHPEHPQDLTGVPGKMWLLPAVPCRLSLHFCTIGPIHQTGSTRGNPLPPQGHRCSQSLQDHEAEVDVRFQILAYPQFHGKPFILDTDFSVNPGAIGGVLLQEQDGQGRVIAYGARRLQPRERNYASTKGELLAVIFFLQYYKYYLLHRPFILRTDNRALTWIQSLESPYRNDPLLARDSGQL